MKKILFFLVLLVSFPALSQSYIIPNKNARAMAVNICDDTLKVSSLKIIKSIEVIKQKDDDLEKGFKLKKEIGAHNISVPLDILINGTFTINVIWKNGDYILFTLINWRMTSHEGAKLNR